MQLDELKHAWDNASGRDDGAPLDREDVVRLVEAGARSTRARMRRRLSAEKWYYLPAAVATVAALVMKWGVGKMIFWAPVALVLVIVAVTMAFGSRMLNQVEIAGDVRSALAKLIRNYDFVMKLYMIEYMIMIAAGVAVAVTVAGIKYGLGRIAMAFLAIGVLALLWADRKSVV